MNAEHALATLRRAYAVSFNGRDADAVAALHTESSIAMPAGMSPVVGREAIRALMAVSIAAMPRSFRFRFEPQEVRIADTWAIERGVTPGVPPFPAGKYVMLYERDADGSWRIAWTITNSDATPSSAPLAQ